MSISTLASRLQYNGGDQIGRINKQKLRSLYAALKNDYNSRMIQTPLHSAYPCLINTNNLKTDYDKEYISVDFDSGLQAGDTFELLDNHTHWMIYLPVITETAYLKAEIIRCRYTLEIDGEKYWIYFQGPTETDLRWYIKSGTNFNELNLSGTIYIKNTPTTKKYFKRFTHLKIDGHMWEVQVTDSISVPGIIELEVQEYYDNSIAELPEILREHVEEAETIIGQTFVKQDDIVGYQILPQFFNPQATWSIQGNPRVQIQEIMDDGRTCKVKIFDGAIGSYKVVYDQYTIECNIDWEEPVIKGPQLVYPYETHTYFLKHAVGTFILESELAKIIEQGDDYCKVEILTGKKGKFLLQCEINFDTYDEELRKLGLLTEEEYKELGFLEQDEFIDSENTDLEQSDIDNNENTIQILTEEDNSDIEQPETSEIPEEPKDDSNGADDLLDDIMNVNIVNLVVTIGSL